MEMRHRWRQPRELTSPDPHLGFTTTPNYESGNQWAGRIIWVYTDNRGARAAGPDTVVPNTLDIVAVGSEETFGIGVEHDETYIARLGKQLGWTAGNFGISDQNGVAALLTMERLRTLKPKVIVYGFWHVHLERNVNIFAGVGGPICREVPAIVGHPPRIRLPAKAYFDHELVLEWNREAKYLQLENSFWLRLKWKLIRKLMDMRRQIHAKSPSNEETEAEMIEGGCFMLSRMNQAAEEIGAKLVVVYIPPYDGRPTRGLRRQILTALKELRHTILVDMSQPFGQELSQGRALAVPGLGTPNPRAHEIIADAVAEALEREGVVGSAARGAA